MNRSCDYELFILPIVFQTISFHHRANYFIQITPKPSKRHRFQPFIITQQLFTSQQQNSQILDENGNMWNLQGNTQTKGAYSTNRFQIDYNDQHVRFNSAFLLRFTVIEDSTHNQQEIALRFQLFKHEQNVLKNGQIQQLKTPLITKVSAEEMLINLSLQFKNEIRDSNNKVINANNYRKIVFPTNEYISFLDIAYVYAHLGKKAKLDDLLSHSSIFSEQQKHDENIDCCVSQKKKLKPQKNPDQILRKIYEKLIEEKLYAYKLLKARVIISLKKYEAMRLQFANFYQATKVTQKYQSQFIQPDILDLQYISVYESMQEYKQEGQYESNHSLKKVAMSQQLGRRLFSDTLSQHYQCQTNQVFNFIYEQSLLLQINIRSLFERQTQLQFVLAADSSRFIIKNEIQRVQYFISKSEQLFKKQINLTSSILQSNSNIQLKMASALISKHTKTLKTSMCSLRNITFQQLKQPLLVILTQCQQISKKPIQTQNTLTVLVHGYRGNEFDLSKVKSHLHLYLGLTNFYSIKGLNTVEIINEPIAKLGQIAGEQLNKYLQSNSKFQTINFIGFSLGGVIIRALLPHIRNHKNKVNLLVTFASPHLGMREVESCLVRAGLFYMRQVAQIESIKDLYTDNDQSAYLANLADCQCIQWFNRAIFVGSHDDNYIPSHSSLAHYRGQETIARQMSDKLNMRLRGKVSKCLIKLQFNQTIWDQITRRKAHIAFLQNDCFLRYFLIKFKQFFVTTRDK